MYDPIVLDHSLLKLEENEVIIILCMLQMVMKQILNEPSEMLSPQSKLKDQLGCKMCILLSVAGHRSLSTFAST